MNFKHNDNSSNVDYRTILSVVSYLGSQPFVDSNKIAIMGVKEAGTISIQAAAADTNLVGVISLCSATRSQDVDATTLVDKLSPRPLVIIASNQDSPASTTEGQQLFDSAKEPKKLVWLSTKMGGTEILNTDLEPVVRQVTLLFMKKYLK